MKRSASILVAAGVVGLLSRGLAGCAGTDEPDHAPPASDASPDVVAEDAAPIEAGADARQPLPECSVDGFCPTKLPLESIKVDPDPNGVRLSLTSVWVDPEHHAWAVAASGHVLRWDGASWSVVFLASAGLRSVWGSSATDVWLAGDAGLLLHGTGSAGALEFQQITAGTAHRITRVWGTSSTDVWLLTDRVLHLTAESATTPTPFAPVTVPSSFGSAVEFVRISAVWGNATDTWFGGSEVSHCAPPNCVNANRLYVARRHLESGKETWSTVPMPVPRGTSVPFGVTTAEDVQAVALATDAIEGSAYGAWVAGDASKLDPARGPITAVGPLAWNSEVTQKYGQPEGLWGRSKSDLWLIGQYGVVRHFDGRGWQVPRVSRSALAPLVNHLHGIDAVVNPSGERDMWIVGDDIALRRKGMP